MVWIVVYRQHASEMAQIKQQQIERPVNPEVCHKQHVSRGVSVVLIHSVVHFQKLTVEENHRRAESEV
jgi:hypothetical protein